MRSPRHSQTLRNAQIRDAACPYPAPMRDVILLEDEAVLREELSEFLAGNGYRVDAEASLEGFRRSYDPARHGIALVDLGLPDGDGLVLIRE